MVAQGTPDELKCLVPGGHISLQFADEAGLDAATRVVDNVQPDRDTLMLQIPGDGSVRLVKALLDQLWRGMRPPGEE